MWQKEKFLIVSNFTICHNVFQKLCAAEACGFMWEKFKAQIRSCLNGCYKEVSCGKWFKAQIHACINGCYREILWDNENPFLPVIKLAFSVLRKKDFLYLKEERNEINTYWKQ